jgi:hypothetical protein
MEFSTEGNKGSEEELPACPPPAIFVERGLGIFVSFVCLCETQPGFTFCNRSIAAWTPCKARNISLRAASAGGFVGSFNSRLICSNTSGVRF